jgi:phosphoenolpyruvate carboxylase
VLLKVYQSSYTFVSCLFATEIRVSNRFPYLDPLNHVQVELLKEHRKELPDGGTADEQVLRDSADDQRDLGGAEE